MFTTPSEAALSNNEDLNELSRKFKEDLARIKKESQRLDRIEIAIKVGTIIVGLGAVCLIDKHYSKKD